MAERAVETGDAGQLVAVLEATVRDEAERRLGHVLELRAQASADVPAARAYTSAMLGFLVCAHKAWSAVHARPVSLGEGRMAFPFMALRP